MKLRETLLSNVVHLKSTLVADVCISIIKPYLRKIPKLYDLFINLTPLP